MQVSPNIITAFLERVRDADNPGGQPACFDAIAQRWRELGVRPGDLVLLSLPNGFTLLDHYFGVLAAEGMPGLLPPALPSARLAETARSMGARAIAALRLPSAHIGEQSRESVANLDAAVFRPREEPAGEPGEAVLLTSGTSGFSSGCLFDFEAHLRNGQRHADSIGQTAADTVLINLPLHFSFALVAQALATMSCGGRLVISGPPFHSESYFRSLAAYDVTISSLTPILVRRVMSAITANQVCFDSAPCLRTLTIGGDTIPVAEVEDVLKARPGRELYLTYGLTEAGPRVSTCAAHDEPPERYESVGLPIEGTRVDLRESAGRPGVKQLFVSSDTVMKRRIGSVHRLADTESTEPGTVATGDIFEQDGGDYLFYRGRLSDYIVRNGERICVSAVRHIAEQLPGVLSARTIVTNQSDGGGDFRLVLQVREKSHEGEYRGLLARWLRGAEMPAGIDLALAGDSAEDRHK